MNARTPLARHVAQHHLSRHPVPAMVALDAALLVGLALFVAGYCVGRVGHPADLPNKVPGTAAPRQALGR